MNTPLHPMIVHFPIALAFVLPILIVVFAYMIKTGKMHSHAFLVIIGLQLVTTVTGYVALETGEDDEHIVKNVVDKKIIHAHEEAAEIFVASTVIALVLSIAAFFLRRELQFYGHMLVCLVTLISCYLGYVAGHLGGELIYRHGAAGAYTNVRETGENTGAGLLPTPGLNTSESPMPVNEDEEFKVED